MRYVNGVFSLYLRSLGCVFSHSTPLGRLILALEQVGSCVRYESIPCYLRQGARYLPRRWIVRTISPDEGGVYLVIPIRHSLLRIMLGPGLLGTLGEI